MEISVKPIVVVDVGILTAFLHGLLSFFTPCMLPLIPFLVSLTGSKKGFWNLLMFVSGFSATFTFMGLFSAELGSFVPSNVLRIISGTIVLVFGFLFALDVSIFKVGKILKFVLERGESFPSIFLGMSLGLVWIPCSTPILASILAIAAQTSEKSRGALLLFVYSLGILLPFLTVGGILDKWLSPSGKWRIFIRTVGGLGMSIVGVLILIGCLNFSP